MLTYLKFRIVIAKKVAKEKKHPARHFHQSLTDSKTDARLMQDGPKAV